MGTTLAIDVREQSPRDAMAELGMTEGYDAGLECSGSPYAFDQMLSTMNHGGRIALIGLPPSESPIHWSNLIFKGLVIKGIYGREMFETWYKVATLLQSGLDLSPILTHRFSATDFRAGFDAMLSGRSGKVVLDWTE